MRNFLISYFYSGGRGRSFATTSDERVITEEVLKDWEASVASNLRVDTVGITSFQELEGPVSKGATTPRLSRVQECPECGSTSLSWDSRNKAPAGVPEGRLRTNEVDCEFFLGCDECSETVDTLPVTEVIRQLNHARSAG